MGNDLTPILVTGASGYLGGRVLRLLASRQLPAIGTSRGEADGLVRCELADAAAVAAMMRDLRPTVVIHCAAAVPRTQADFLDAAAAESSVQMIEALLQHAPQHVIFASSMTVYPDGTPKAREGDARVAGPGYAAGKLRAEALLLEHPTASATILRLPGLFGAPRESGVLFNAARAFAGKEEFHVRIPVPQWAALHVDDAADALIRAVRLSSGKRVMNVGYPERMAVADAVARIAALFGREWAELPPRWFELCVDRFRATLGPVQGSFDARLREVAERARAAVGCHA